MMMPVGGRGVSSGDVLATARAGNWWSSKLPPLLAIGFAQLLRRGSAPQEAMPALAAATVALCALAWHAHVVNDLCDIEDDARAGKPNRMAGASPLWRWLLVTALPVVGLLAAASPYLDTTTPVFVLAANFVVFALYSVPPIRLKKRGWLGAVADASGAHAVPTLFVLSAMPGGLGQGALDWFFAAAAIVGAFAVGMRGIIMHQFADRRADEQAQLRTVGTMMTVATARALVRGVLLPVEAVALVVVVAVLLPHAPLLLVATVLFIAVELAKVRRGWTLPQFEAAERSHERYVPLMNNDAHELWLPMVLALQLAAGTYAFLPLPLLMVAMFLEGMRSRITALVALSRDEPGPVRAVAGRHGIKQRRSGRLLGRNRHEPTPTNPLSGASIIVGSPNWARNGVNLHSLKLVRGLVRRGLKARVLLTEEETDLVTVNDPRFEVPADLPVDRLPVSRTDGWGAHWGAMVRYLEGHAPCVYLPTYDWRHACVVPRLSSRVQVVSDLVDGDPLSHEQVQRLGAYLSAIVVRGVDTLAAMTASFPEFADRLVMIPSGIDMPDDVSAGAERRPMGAVLVCSSGLEGWKGELPSILDAMTEQRLTPCASIVASPDHPERGAAEVLGSLARVTETVGVTEPRTAFAEHHVVLAALLSDHVPTELLEAMGSGCIPFLIDCGIRSHTLFRNGENCFVFEKGDAAGIAQRMVELDANPQLRATMSSAAHDAAHEWFISFELELDHYIGLFGALVDPSRPEHYRRPVGGILAPPTEVAGINVFPVSLQHSVAGVGSFPSVREFDEFIRRVGRGAAAAPNADRR